VTGDWASQVVSGTDTDFDIFLVCKTDDAAPSAVRAFLNFGNSADSDSNWSIAIRNGTNNYRTTKTDDGGTSVNVDGGALDTSYHVLRITQHGTTVDLRDNGSAIFTGSSQDVGLTTVDNVCLFALLRGGASTNALLGSVAEMITYNAALSAGDGLVVEQYLRTAWAL
jgi:hypothetical protein